MRKSSDVKEAQHSEHHEQTQNSEKVFIDGVQKLTTIVKEFGNPLQEKSAELLTLDTMDTANPDNAALVAQHSERKASKCNAFMKALELEAHCTIHLPIRENKVGFLKDRNAFNYLPPLKTL